MLSEQRYRMILKILEEKRSVTVTGQKHFFPVFKSLEGGLPRSMDLAGLEAGQVIEHAIENCKKKLGEI